MKNKDASFRHSREGGNPANVFLDSRLRGNDEICDDLSPIPINPIPINQNQISTTPIGTHQTKNDSTKPAPVITRRRFGRLLSATSAACFSALSNQHAFAQTLKQPAYSSSSSFIWTAWQQFAKQFLSDGGRVVDTGSARSQTFSEGQGYALFFALVANDKERFARLLTWTENNLCQGDITAHLPAWLWGKRDDETWGVIDSNSASDADLWIAYALGEAGRLWREPRYVALSGQICARVLREECADLPKLGLSLLPAPKGFQKSAGLWRLNASYMPPHLMRWLAVTQKANSNSSDQKNSSAFNALNTLNASKTPKALKATANKLSAWEEIEKTSEKIIVGSAPNKIASDWILYDAQRGFLPDFSDEQKPALASYNAIRCYTWIGFLHPESPNKTRLLNALSGMAQWVRLQGVPPEEIDTRQNINKLLEKAKDSSQASNAAPVGFSAALLPYFQAMGDQNAVDLQLQRLQAKPPRFDAYYEQVLSLFGLGHYESWFRFDLNGRVQPKWEQRS